MMQGSSQTPNLPTQGPVKDFPAGHQKANGLKTSADVRNQASDAAQPGSVNVPTTSTAAAQERGQASIDRDADDEPGSTGRVGTAAEGHSSRWRRKLKPSWLEMDHVLKLTTPSLKWPDYSKVDNVNHLIAGLWPYISDAAEALVKEQLEPWARDFVKQMGRGILVGLSCDVLELGDNPMWLEAVKTYDTEEDELIFEGPVAWASTMKARISADIKLLGMSFKLPLEIRNVQMRVHARLTARPITETAPFIGSVTLTLLEKPHLDFDMPLVLPRAVWHPLHNWHGLDDTQEGYTTGTKDSNGRPNQRGDKKGTAIRRVAEPPAPEAFTLDLAAIPLVRFAIKLAARLAARALLMFPKGYTLETVPGGAQRPWPEGMLQLRLIKITGLRSEDLISMSDPYCILQVREGRMNRSRTINNNNDPEYNEQFTMLVDSVQRQVLRLVVKDEDWGPKDKILGVAELPLTQAPFLLCPGMRVPLTMTLRKVRLPRSSGILTSPLNFLLGVPIDAATAGTEKLAKAFKGSGKHAHGSSSASSDGHGRSHSDSDVRAGRDQDTSSSADGPGPGSGSGESGGAHHLQGRRARQAERAQGEQHAALARLREGARRAVHAGHQEEDEVEVVAEYMRKAQQLEGQQGHEDGVDARQRHQRGQSVDARAHEPGHSSTQQRAQQQNGAEPGQRQSVDGSDADRRSSDDSADEMSALMERQMQEEGIVEAGRSKLRRGQVQNQLKAETRGTVFLEAVWTPFKRRPEMLEGPGGGPGFGCGLGPPIAYERAQQQGPVHDSDVGILTITLLRCTHLTGWSAEPDPYVKFMLHDKVQHKQQTQMSSVVYNEPHPRWGEKHDFIMISAGSVLVITVMDKTTPAERLATFKLKGRFCDHEIGHIRVPVQHVAAAGRLQHQWPLLGSEQGAIELVLEWFPASVVRT